MAGPAAGGTLGTRRRAGRLALLDEATPKGEVPEAGNGQPARRQQTQASGRAFLVVSFEMRSREEQAFLVAGERLVAVRRESQGSGAGAGEKGESLALPELQLLP